MAGGAGCIEWVRWKFAIQQPVFYPAWVMETQVKKSNTLIPQASKTSQVPEGQELLQGEKYLLRLRTPDAGLIAAVAARHSISQPIARVLVNRGFVSQEEITSFLFTSYEKDVSHASLLKDSEIALARLEKAIDGGEKILIFGDYDVDGISSSALMMCTLLPLGANINYFLPNRKRDGYGLSTKVVRKAKENGYDLIITVDNGIGAHEAAQEAHDIGIDLIITDHHRQHGDLPKALAIINPNRDECTYPCKSLPGVGVIFKIIAWLYEKRGLELPVKAYELLMLGTIADVVPLLGETRYWVRHGLSLINKQKSYAMQVLARNGKLTKPRLSSLDIGFMVAPQLNALGRLSDPRDAVKFMISAQYDDVDRVGKVLLEMNEERKKVERKIYEEIELQVTEKKIDLSKENVIISCKSGWPTGVIGLVAGRLMHNFGRPTLLFHEGKDGILKGSCRSIREFNIFDALVENEDLLLKFGGHSFAAGLSLKKENLPKLKENLEAKVARDLTAYDLLQKQDLDGELELSEMDTVLLSDLEKLEPFGHQNSQPAFLVRNVTLMGPPKLLKEKHLKCMLFSHGIKKPIILFNRPELLDKLLAHGDKPFHIVGNVVKNEWQGRTNIELLGIDIVIPREG